MAGSWEYTGVDVRGSRSDNVDVVMPGQYMIPFPDQHFDAIITMACFEHARNPFKLMAEASRVLKPGGLFLFSAPFIHPPHDHFDGWRFLPKGVRVLFEESNIKRLNSYLTTYKEFSDCWAVGRKRL
jgi:SAM-dependent methyltransferase